MRTLFRSKSVAYLNFYLITVQSELYYSDKVFFPKSFTAVHSVCCGLAAWEPATFTPRRTETHSSDLLVKHATLCAAAAVKSVVRMTTCNGNDWIPLVPVSDLNEQRVSFIFTHRDVKGQYWGFMSYFECRHTSHNPCASDFSPAMSQRESFTEILLQEVRETWSIVYMRYRKRGVMYEALQLLEWCVYL